MVLPEHPPLLPVTVYEVVVNGVSVIELSVEPVDHRYVVAPETVNVVVCPAQIVVEFTVMAKLFPTVTVATAVPEHPPLVPVTVYEVVAVGDSVIEFDVAPVDHKYVVPPAAVNVADCPVQIVSEFTVIAKAPPTVIVATAVPEHPPLVPVTVYELVVAGDSVIEFDVAPVDHKYVVPPAAFNVADCPVQIVSEFTVMAKGPLTVTVATAVPEHPPLVPVTVYDVVVVGDFVIELAVAPVDHE